VYINDCDNDCNGVVDRWVVGDGKYRVVFALVQKPSPRNICELYETMYFMYIQCLLYFIMQVVKVKSVKAVVVYRYIMYTVHDYTFFE